MKYIVCLDFETLPVALISPETFRISIAKNNMINEFNKRSPRLGTNKESAKTKGSKSANPSILKLKPSCPILSRAIAKKRISIASIRFRSLPILLIDI